jgi:hypothetical protein
MVFQRTFDGFREVLEEAKSTRDNAGPSIAQGLGDLTGLHLHESGQSEDAQLLVVDARELVLAVDSSEPMVEKFPSGSSLLLLHQVESGGGVVEDGIDEDFKVGETESGGLDVLLQGKGGVDDDVEVLRRK